MKRLLAFFVACLALSSVHGQAQSFTYKWQRVAMDTTYEYKQPNLVDSILVRYQPGIESLMEIIAYSEVEMDKHKPESSLSNLAADIILDEAIWSASDLISLPIFFLIGRYMSETKLLAMALIAELKLDRAAARRPIIISPRRPVGMLFFIN
jgi:hypothetical protein